MQHITVLRQLANEHIHQFNRMTAKGLAASVEVQTETALETLAEVAERCGYPELYRLITDRQHLLELHDILPLITVMGGKA